MSQNRRDTLTSLDEHLSQVTTADDVSRQRLDDTRQDIRTALERMKEDSVDEDATLIERLQQAVYDFEGDHPDVAAAINTVLTSLSNMGL